MKSITDNAPKSTLISFGESLFRHAFLLQDRSPDTFARKARRGVSLTAVAAGISCSFFSVSASAATPQEICGRQESSLVTVRTTNAELNLATNAAEAILASVRDPLSGDRALDQLVVPEAGSETLNPGAIAAYCGAAGEAMRVARSGSGNRAQTFLVTALSQAEQADVPQLRAGIAYRLALVSRNLPVRPNARSARRAISNVVQPLELPTDLGDGRSQDQCNQVLRSQSTEQSNWAASKLALECAVLSAGTAGFMDVVAVSQLQISRISLAEAGRRAVDRDFLREEAAIASTAGLGSVAGIADRSRRYELTARLVEATIDAGYGMLPQNAAGLAQLTSDISTDPGEQAWKYALQGRVLMASGQADQAAGHFQRAIFFESQRRQPLRLADWYLLLADAEPGQREAHVMEAYQALEAIRPLLPASDPITEESLFTLRMRPVFNAAVDVQLAGGKASADGTASDSVLLAQRIVESFRQAEIQYVFGPDCVPPRIPVSPSDLKVGEILLYPILLQDRVEVLYASKTAEGVEPKYQRYSVAQGADLERIESMVKEVSFELGYGVDDIWKGPASTLYSLLIKPIEDQLNPDTTLVIVPDGILRRLPFGALRAADGKMLIEKTRLSIAPSLAYTQPGTENKGNPHIIAASLSQSVDLPAGFFPALEATSSEAKMAAGLGNPDKPLGAHLENFSREDLIAAFSKSSINVLHLATHASFNGRSDRSFIVAEDEAILLSELRELIGSSLSNGELLSLIILSACETAVGDDQASMGLAGAAVQAGSESAIASLWEVDDAGTARLMKEFYQFYAQGQGKAEALRNAQMVLINEGGDLSDPGIWAAFTLLGAWR